MKVDDPGKLLLLGLSILGAMVLLLFDRISEAGGLSIITAAMGAILANGRLASRGGRPQGLFAPRKLDEGQALDDVDADPGAS